MNMGMHTITKSPMPHRLTTNRSPIRFYSSRVILLAAVAFTTILWWARTKPSTVLRHLRSNEIQEDGSSFKEDIWAAIYSSKAQQYLTQIQPHPFKIDDLVEASGFAKRNDGTLEMGCHNAMTRVLIDHVSILAPSPPQGLNVLEVGSGTGALAALLMARSKVFANSRYVGFDVTVQPLQMAHKYFTQRASAIGENASLKPLVPTFLVGSATEMTGVFVPSSFDLAFCNSIMQYFEGGLQDAELMLAGMFEAVRPGGLVVLGDIQDQELEKESLKFRAERNHQRDQHTAIGKGKQLYRTYYREEDLRRLALGLGAATVEVLRMEKDLGIGADEFTNAPFSYTMVITKKP